MVPLKQREASLEYLLQFRDPFANQRLNVKETKSNVSKRSIKKTKNVQINPIMFTSKRNINLS
jgi:hypothetical protein